MRKKEGVLNALIHFVILTIVIIVVTGFVAYKKTIIGPILILSGFLPLVPLKLQGRKVKSTGADLLYGAMDTGIMSIFALTGASLAGVLGGILGAGVGDAITDGFAGIFEGKMSEILRKNGIDENRTPLSISMGKMSGCLVGFGIVLTFAWTVIGL